jgi:hypothetical protein
MFGTFARKVMFVIFDGNRIKPILSKEKGARECN